MFSIPAWSCGPLGIAILLVYQVVLSSGLNVYLLSPVRGPGLISLNKEGIFSTFGYWGLYMVSVHLGYILNSKQTSVVVSTSPAANNKQEAKVVALRVGVVVGTWILDAFLWGLATWSDYYFERISRRTCNLAYVLFVLAQNFEVIGIFMLAEVLVPLRELALLNAFNRNLLPTFLVANVLTGVVNMSMYTIFLAPVKAFATVLLYAFSLVGIMGLADAKKLRLKFW
jgi:phosphatidylinositol glycan class W